jgi:predicted SnoaL-like aldol condensation-catalyzing enzyme
MGIASGAEGLVGLIGSFVDSMPDRNAKNLDILAEGDLVTVRYRVTVTVRGTPAGRTRRRQTAALGVRDHRTDHRREDQRRQRRHRNTARRRDAPRRASIARDGPPQQANNRYRSDPRLPAPLATATDPDSSLQGRHLTPPTQ